MPTDPERSTAAGGLGAPRAPRQDGPRPDGTRRWTLSAAGMLLALAAVAAFAALLLDRKDARETREDADRRRAVAQEVVRLRRIQAPHRGGAVELRPADDASREELLTARTALLDRTRASILGDAKRRADSGELDGPIVGVTCGPLTRDPGTKPDHLVLTRTVGRYDCLAVKRREGSEVDLGHPFVAALDFRRFTYVWCRDNPAPSERGESLAFVRLERACLAARGKALGTGYAATPEDEG